MAAQGFSVRLSSLPIGAVAFVAVAGMAGLLSLAAALVALTGGATSAPTASVQDELRARSQRVAFFEDRARADVLDFASLNLLAFEYLQRARETGSVDDYARAEAAALRSLEILPNDNLNGALALASVRLVQHDYAAALALSDVVLALKPSSASGYGLRGDALAGLGRYNAAEAVYQQMVLLEPALPALSRLAGLAFIEGDARNTEDFWRQAIRGSDGLPAENRAWAEVQLGRFYFSRGNLGRAEKQYSVALKRYPDYVHALAGLASVKAARERWDEAIALYQTVQDRLPQPEYVVALGDVFAAAGQLNAAQAQYDLVEVIDRLYRANGVNTDLAIALFYADHDRRFDLALQAAEAAYAAAPGVYAADVYAWALYKAGHYTEAERLITEALRAGTPEARFYYHAGLIRRAVSDRPGAIAQLETALRLNPYFSPLQAADARRGLAELRAGR